ncbi:NitT/TauT family transport system substrate-binding protein [Herbihabitans rhizosphaerae]|uniref:NitT/TauT family transport system substrate-binding protein n=1 Tax=Herbihabitans rhizosphaerae TaxID=1872711 RepID=A0A4Q7KWS3_9PSEU|nr:ABC transporter substrate-binding protein [Herbihabitans rhizosphaerae]RZS41046.1 NitT/TauT family transport system substrate-binding protein [Herbihabitans rhizosphaerae]
MIALTLVAALTSCGLLGDDTDDGNSSSGQVEKTKIKAAMLPVVDVAPFYYAIEKGYFKAEGLEVEPVEAKSGKEAIDSLINGSVDVAFASYPAPMLAQSKNAAKFTIVADGLTAKTGHIVVVAPPNSPMKKPQDAPGRKIAITAKNTFSDLAPKSVFKTLGVDYGKIQWVEMGFPEMIPAMERGDVDGAVLVEPWVTLAQKRIGAVPVVDGATGATAEMPMSGYVALAGEGKLGSTSPKTIAAFNRAMVKAQTEATDRTKMEPMFVKYAKVDQQTAPLVTLSIYPTSLQAARIQRVANLMSEFGVITGTLDVNQMLPKT